MTDTNKCYNKDCSNQVDFQTTGSFFCCPECKEKYNGGVVKSDTARKTIGFIRAKLNQWSDERRMKGQMAFRPQTGA